MKKISEIFLRGKWLKKEEHIEKIKNITEEYSKELKKISDYNYELLEDKGKYYNLYKMEREVNEEHKKLNGELREENKKYKEAIDRTKEYIEKCLKQTPIENRTKSDDTLDIEYEYVLGILKEVE